MYRNILPKLLSQAFVCVRIILLLQFGTILPARDQFGTNKKIEAYK